MAIYSFAESTGRYTALAAVLCGALGCDSPPLMPDAEIPIDAATSADAGVDDAAMEMDAGQPLPERMQGIVNAIRPAMYECPERVWPGIADAYRNSQVLFVDQAGGVGYVFNDRRGSPPAPVVTRIDTADLDRAWLSTFNVGVLNGVPTLGISLDATAEINDIYDDAGLVRWHDFAVIFALHEGFHFLSGQTAWSLPTEGSRAQPYPERWEPRYLRAALGRSLVDIIRGTSGASPAVARYWHDRFEAEHPEDAARIAATDIAEGTAYYAEIVSAALGELGCDATPAELRATMIAHLSEYTNFSVFDGANEAYALGVAAGLSMRFEMREGWQAAVEAGSTPVSVFLDGVTPAAAADDPTLQQQAQDAVAERNDATAMEIEPMLTRLDNPEYYRLPLAADWVAGSLRTGGFYILTERAGTPQAVLTLEAEVTLPSTDTVTVAGQSVVFVTTTPCPGLESGGFYIAQVARADVTASGAEHSAATADVTFTDLTASVVSADGLSWLCPTPSE